MRISFITVTLGASLLAFGCSQSDQQTSSTTSSEALVSVEGVNAGGLRSALLAISDVDVSADGTKLSASIDEASANLAQAGEKLALRVALPAQARVLDVRITFDDFGGYDAKNGKAGEIDARGTAIHFQLPVRELDDDRHASIRLDLARSVVRGGGTRAVLLPQYVLRY